MVVFTHRRFVKSDAALIARPAAHGDKTAAITHRACCDTTLKRTVSQTIHPVGHGLTNLRGNIVTTRHDDIRTQPTHQCFVGGRRISNNAQPIRLRQLHHVAAIAARRTRNRQRLAGPKCELIQRLARSQPIHRQRRRLDQRFAGGDMHHCVG